MAFESCAGSFIPDISRGHWSVPNDFIYAGLSLGFRLDILGTSWNRDTYFGVTSAIPKYLICLIFYIVPLLVVQSFMGQFSNSGFISAFRLSPFFKGIGYVALILNIGVVIYFSLFALIPLVYLFGSINPTLPWDCERLLNITEVLTDQPCEFSNATDCRTSSMIDCYFRNNKLPTVTYFESLFNNSNIFGMSWQMIIATISVWVILGFILYAFSSIEKIGKVIRYSVRAVLVLLVLFIARFWFLPDASRIYFQIFIPNWTNIIDALKTIPAHGISAFDPGWGLFITLASFNKFKTNIWRSSCLIGLGQIFIIFGLDILEKFMEQYLKASTFDHYQGEHAKYRTLYLASGTIIADMAWPNFWSTLYYCMLFLSAITLMIIQLYSILYSIFDEFISLRNHKIQVTMLLLSIMTISSLYLTSILGVNNFGYLQLEIYIIQSLFDFLIILIVFWIYGHTNFQRDMEFMINGKFSNWKVYILKFLIPVVMLISVLLGLIFYYVTVIVFNDTTSTLLEYILRPLPWLCIIIYAIYCLFKVKGSLTDRWEKCYHPNDWYPVEDEEREKYTIILNNSFIINQLNTRNRYDKRNIYVN